MPEKTQIYAAPLNTFAHVYEDAVIDLARDIVMNMINHHLPPIRTEMTILDLACGSGPVTRIIYEHCKAQGIEPPKIIGVDIGPNLIEAYNASVAARDWHTAKGIVGDAANLDMLSDDTFDLVIMNMGLFFLNDFADKGAAEIRRVLKPQGIAAVTAWRLSWIQVMVLEANKNIGRPEAETKKLEFGKWDKEEGTRDALIAGGFEPAKLKSSQFDGHFFFDDVEQILDRFDQPLWHAIATATWTEEQKPLWRSEIAKLITEEQKAEGRLPAYSWLFIVEK